jgi:regulator of protease activity HflC (stomatin/prohibitin superfamily)
VPTKNGLAVSMKATLLYHLDPTRAPAMAREVGATEYQDRVVSPYFKNAVRDVTAEFLPEAFYSADRGLIEARIADRLRHEFEARGLVVESVMLLEPVLPDLVRQRIEAKVGAEQDAARMEYVLKQKELEAKAKVVEAKGIAEAQSIVKKDLDDNYLRYLWIKALSENHGATIYVPTGADGMPFFKPIHSGKDK